MPDPAPVPRSVWSRSTFALAFAVYGWTMMGVELYLAGAPLAEGPDRGLTLFRREVMGRAVVGLGGAAVLAAIILAVLGLRSRRHRGPALAALALAAAWLACLARLWPI
jgi:Mn2+/Fe2+ NRAMP family transporter